MAGAMLVAFLVAKAGHARLVPRSASGSPSSASRRTSSSYPIAARRRRRRRVYYWRKPDVAQYANEVAEELSKVTWPSRKEVTNSTTVVVVTTLFATVFFAPHGPVLGVRHRQDLQLLTATGSEPCRRDSVEPSWRRSGTSSRPTRATRTRCREALQQRVKEHGSKTRFGEILIPTRDRDGDPRQRQARIRRRPAFPATSSSRWR